MKIGTKIIFHGGWGDNAFSYPGEIIGSEFHGQTTPHWIGWDSNRHTTYEDTELWVALISTGSQVVGCREQFEIV